MLNIVILLCIILLVFAVSGVSFFSKTMPKRFAELNNSFFTLFVCVTQDGWVEIYDEFKVGSRSRECGVCCYVARAPSARV